MPYIDTKYLFKCETCRNFRNNVCRTFCESGEGYSPSMSKIPTADVAPRAEVAREIFAELRENGKFNEPIVDYICLSFDELAEIEKKYTEVQTDDNQDTNNAGDD